MARGVAGSQELAWSLAAQWKRQAHQEMLQNRTNLRASGPTDRQLPAACGQKVKAGLGPRWETKGNFRSSHMHVENLDIFLMFRIEIVGSDHVPRMKTTHLHPSRTAEVTALYGCGGNRSLAITIITARSEKLSTDTSRPYDSVFLAL